MKPLILAIEPDRRQAAKITTLARTELQIDIVVADSTELALEAIARRVPDLILTSLLLSRRDEALLTDRLRELDAAGTRVPTLVVPVLGAPRRSRSQKGLLTRLRGARGGESSTDGGDGGFGSRHPPRSRASQTWDSPARTRTAASQAGIGAPWSIGERGACAGPQGDGVGGAVARRRASAARY
jgi:CheY-like chemotaxis protein